MRFCWSHVGLQLLGGCRFGCPSSGWPLLCGYRFSHPGAVIVPWGLPPANSYLSDVLPNSRQLARAKLRGSRRYLALANVDPAEAGVDSGCRWMCRNTWRCPPGAKLCGSGRYLALANVDPAEAGAALLHYLPLRPVIGPPRPDTSCGNTTCDYREFEASLAPARLLEEGSGWAARDKSATGASRSESFRLKPWLSNCCVAASSHATASTIVGLVPPATS